MSYVWNAIFFITGLTAGAVLLAFGLATNPKFVRIDLPSAYADCFITPK
jgi:hypothetical protein